MSHQFRNPEPHLYFSTKGTSANAAKVQDQQMLPSPPYFTNSALTSKFNKNCIYYNLATFCFLPNFFYKPLQSSVNCILAPALASILGHPQRPSITKRNTFTGISLGAFPYAEPLVLSRLAKKSSSPCLHLLLEAIFQRVFKLPRWRQLAAAACFVLQVLTGGSTPFHKKCTTVLPHLDLEMHEFLKKYLAAVDPKNV